MNHNPDKRTRMKNLAFIFCMIHVDAWKTPKTIESMGSGKISTFVLVGFLLKICFL